jgi:hypothetical protein
MTEEMVNKILHGLDLAYEKMIAEKKLRHQELVVLQDGKIVTTRL